MEIISFNEEKRKLFEESPIPFAIYHMVDKRVVTLVLSKGLMEMLDIGDREEAYHLMDNDMYRDAHPDDVARVADAAVRFATEGKEYNVVYRTMIKGSYHVLHSRGKHIYTDEGERLAIVWYMDEGLFSGDDDDRFRKYLQKEIMETGTGFKASYDYLTGLPSMNYFFELAEAGRDRILEEGQNLALLFFDLDGMKKYNLQYGFTEGDQLLRGFARILTRHFSSENCCRFGGDHFVAYTNNVDLEKRLEEIFEETKELNHGNTLFVRVGIYLDSMGKVGAGLACDRAKMACDLKKNNFASVFNYFNEQMLEESQKQQYILDNIDKAIEEHWIQVYYQPLVRSANGQVCDEEALARWIDPVRGFMSPGDFIPVLENSRLIYKLDLYILEQVLEKIKSMGEKGFYTVPSSINISRSDFESCDIVDEIWKRVEASGVSPEMITIEITESIIGKDIEYMRKQVERFHELGFQVWMDDYGSGYSSPDILQMIPFDTIKLDMEFMRQFDKGENSRIIINGLIKMAMGLGIETVAEGVETEEQAEFLKEAGCTRLQGYHFCKPISMDEILKRYRDGAQIGFENPEETGYYTSIGRVNLYDLSISAGVGEELGDYFDSMPMAVLESGDEVVSVIRSNRTFRELYNVLFPGADLRNGINIENYREGFGSGFLKALHQCGEDGRQIIIDEKTRGGKNLHCLIRRVAINPVTGRKAIMVAVLDITEDKEALSFSNVAQALLADYLYLYYVDLDTEKYIEYRMDLLKNAMLAESHGKDFFATSRTRAMSLLHKEDREAFIEAFNKENVVRLIDKKGFFTYTYRQLLNDEPLYVNMRASRIGSDGKHIIVGINNVNAQMKQKADLERLKEDQIIYARINALTGNYICFYTINPYNNHYSSFSATFDYLSLGLSSEGDDFFKDLMDEADRVIYDEDRERFEREFNKDNILQKIQQADVFVLKYRLIMNGRPRPVRLKAALVNESGRQQLIVGVSESVQE